MSVDVAIVIGTRPEVIRFAPIIKNLNLSNKVNLKVIHTGQHYSDNMNKVFFDELELNSPDFTLTLTENSPAKQTAEIISGVSTLFERITPKLVCVWGDTNSSLGAGLAANKMHLPLMHIEAGCRSGDFNMAEEYNRVVLDHISDFLVPLSTHDKENLIKESVHGKIHPAGDPLYDIFLDKKNTLGKEGSKNNVKKREYVGLLTLHRAENVDSKPTLKRILEGLSRSLNKFNNCDVIFPIHPRTKKMIEKFGLGSCIDSKFINVIDPLGYDEMMELLINSDLAITDSGGFQKEAFFAQKPCITLRKSTEWVDTVKLGVNILVDPLTFNELPDIEKFVKSKSQIFKKIITAPYGDGHATQKIVELITDLARR